MSLPFTIPFFLAVLAISNRVKSAHDSAAQSTAQPRLRKRYLLKQQTQFTDGPLLRHTLARLGHRFEEGPGEIHWGENQPVEVTIYDAQGRPWFALGRDAGELSYFVLRLDRRVPQEDFASQDRLSDEDAGPALAQLAQQYAFVKALRTLLKEGYEVAEDETQRADESRVVILRKREPSSGELHQVRMVFQSAGRLDILTDSQRPDGTHGTCPKMDSFFATMGITEYETWPLPATQQAGEQVRETERSVGQVRVQAAQKHHVSHEYARG